MIAPTLTQVPFTTDDDHAQAEAMARALGYRQTAYTTTSDLWGLFCLQEPCVFTGPARATGRNRLPPYRPGCIIKTRELGLLFVQDREDIGGLDA